MSHSSSKKPPFFQSNAGMAAVEFGLILPILLTMVLGLIELSRYAIFHQKLDKATHAMTDFVTQGETVSTSSLDTFSNTIAQIMQPFAFNGTVIYSSITSYSTLDASSPCKTKDVPCITWQYANKGVSPSRIGNAGTDNPSIPGGYKVSDGQNIIVTEVFCDYAPLLSATGTVIPALRASTVYKVAVYKPRQGTLTKLN